MTYNANSHSVVTASPNDSISTLAWSPNPAARFLTAGSWDKELRCWGVLSSGGTEPKASIKVDAPPLCSDWKDDAKSVFAGCCDGKIYQWSLETGQKQQVGQHTGGVKSCFWIPEMNILAAGSWDKSVKYWDCRQSNPAASVPLSERVYAMDVRHPLMVVVTANTPTNRVQIFDLRTPDRVFREIESPLKLQARTVACMPDKTGFAIGSIEGRVAIHYVDQNSTNNFAFKCHRDAGLREVHSVNAIHYNNQHGTFATVGSDGVVNFWDHHSKQRLKAFSKCDQPISDCKFSPDGVIFAYAVSYDWHKGQEYYSTGPNKNYICLHQCGKEILRRAK